MLSLVLKAEGKILKHYCLLIPYMDAVLKANFPLTPVEVQAKIWMLQPIYRFLDYSHVAIKFYACFLL